MERLEQSEWPATPEFFRCHLIWPWIAQRVISNCQTWLLMLLALSLKSMRITHKWLWSYQMSTVLSNSNTISQVIQSSFKILAAAPFKWSILLQVFLEAQVLCKTKMALRPIYSKWQTSLFQLTTLMLSSTVEISHILSLASQKPILSTLKNMWWRNSQTLWSKPFKTPSTPTC